MSTTLKHWIGDREVEGEHDDVVEDRNPSDLREVLTSYHLLSDDQVRQIVDASEQGAKTWRETSALARGSVLIKAAQLLRDRKVEYGTTIAQENGKTVKEATVEVEKSADFFEYYGSLARAPQGYIISDGRPNTQTRVLQEPLGIVLAICPWNDPMLTPARKLAPALSVGNAGLLKPAEDTPLASVLLAEALRDAGLPTGVLGTLICDIATLESAVLNDRRVVAVTFTGSTRVGNGLRQRLSPRNVRVQTEMGGKNAAIVFGDADMDLAVAAITAGAFAQAGQRCTATSRLIVTADVHDAILERLNSTLDGLTLGNSVDASTDMGPVVSAAHRAGILGHIDRGVSEGAVLVRGGVAPSAPKLINGCFVEPTIFDGVSAEMSLWREEVFGPVLAVQTASSIDDAFAKANDSAYGLSAAVFTSSLSTAERAILALNTGQVSVNLPTSGWDVHHPFGGFKDSGSPFKEQGLEGLRFYTRIKTAAVRFG